MNYLRWRLSEIIITRNAVNIANKNVSMWSAPNKYQYDLLRFAIVGRHTHNYHAP